MLKDGFALRRATMLIPLLALGLSPGRAESPGGDQAKPELVLQTGHALNFAVAVSPDGRWLASGGFDTTVKIWDVTSGHLLRMLAGHADIVMSVAVSPDGRFLASGSQDHTVRLWDVNTGRELRVLDAGQAPSQIPGAPRIAVSQGVTGVVFSPDGQWLASLSDQSIAKVWETASGREVSSVRSGAESIFAIAFAPNGRLLATASQDDSITLWEAATGKEVRTFASKLKGGAGGSVQAAFSPDGRWLAKELSAPGLKIQVREVESGRVMRTLDGHTTAQLSALGLSPDGRLLAGMVYLGREEGGPPTVRIWDVASGREVTTLVMGSGSQPSEEPGFVNLLAFGPDGRWLATGNYNGTIQLWDVATGQELRTLSGGNSPVVKVAFSSDGRLLASESMRTVNLWDTGTGSVLRTTAPPGDARTVGSGAFLARDFLLPLMSADESQIKIWEGATGRDLQTIALPRSEDSFFGKQRMGTSPLHGALSPDRRLLALVDNSMRKSSTPLQQMMSLTDPSTGKINRKAMKALAEEMRKPSEEMEEMRKRSEEMMKQMGQGQVDPSKIFEFAGGLFGGGTIRLWEVETGRERYNLQGHKAQLSSIAFSPDARLLASGGMNDEVKIWDLASGNELRTLSAAPRPGAGLRLGMGLGTVGMGMVPVAFSADSRLLAVGTYDGAISLWEIATGRQVSSLTGHNKAISAFAFGADGRYLASGSVDGTIKLWEVASGREVHTLDAPGLGIISTLTFSPDGRWLVSGGADGSTRFWDAQSGQLLATLVTMGKGNDWLVVTPDGLFDGSPAAFGRILWRFGGNTFNVAPVEVFFNEFFYPGLLGDILAGKKPKSTQDISQRDRRQPQIKLALVEGQGAAAGIISARRVRVKVEVAEALADSTHPVGSGARDVRLFRNGSLVQVWRGDVLEGNSSTLLEATFTVVGGENRLTAYAFSRDNVKSSDVSLVLQGAENLKRPGTAYILAVGINKYSNAEYDLRFAVADAQAFAEELGHQQAQLAAFANIEVIPLLDQNATKSNILGALAQIAGSGTGALPPGSPAALEKLTAVQPEDVVFIYFAGHGTAIGPRFHLIPHDLGYKGRRTELDEAALKTILAHSISDLDLERAFEKLDAGHVVLVIDACNSGQALEAEEKRRGPMNSKGLAQLAYEKGMYILTAAQGNQAAKEVNQLGHGLLTYALVEEGLKTPAADTDPKDGQVETREWLDYATVRVPQLQEAKIDEANKQGRQLTFSGAETGRGDSKTLGLQRPRVFYRREPEAQPLIIAKPGA